ncbi:MAG: rod shape-determining protein [Clostridia bacterium]|nr:rod shape-determining protein [Clostridia bacterium]
MKIGIDLGTKNVIVYSEGKGIVENFPCVIALDTNENKIITIGEDAQKMIGRNPASMKLIRPLIDGAVSDFDHLESLLRYVIKKTCKNAIIKPKIALSKPCITSDFEEAMLTKVALNAGARQVLIVDEAVSAIIGAGVDVSKPEGHLVVDIGGGYTNIAVVTMGQVAKSTTVKFGGNRFDSAIQGYIKRKYNVLIGELSAEETKKSIGGVLPRESEMAYVVKGQSLQTSFPVNVEVSSSELCPILSGIADSIAFETKQLLESTPPQLVADIYKNGLVLTGGGAMLHGIGAHLQQELKIPVQISNEPELCVSRGMKYFLDNYERIINSDFSYNEQGALYFE